MSGEERVPPAWRRATGGEARWPATVAVVVAIALQLTLPGHLSPPVPWLLPALETALLVGIVAVNPTRLNRRSPRLRLANFLLIGVVSVANGWSAAALVVGMVRGTVGTSATPLLVSGASIWATNVLVFALWFWELDRGGPAARAHGVHEVPDFLFPQMVSPTLAPDDWEPEFVDYLYVSFTNATAFSPTDTMPLSHWAKMIMLVQSGVSLVTVALVIARAVNIFR
ncbi:MAG: hypothetical protein ACYCXA_03950 [Actinomycetes bacterium]